MLDSEDGSVTEVRLLQPEKVQAGKVCNPVCDRSICCKAVHWANTASPHW